MKTGGFFRNVLAISYYVKYSRYNRFYTFEFDLDNLNQTIILEHLICDKRSRVRCTNTLPACYRCHFETRQVI